MININGHSIVIGTVALLLILASTSAFGFRCGRKLVIENMHELQVREACGAPTTSRQLGYVTRGVTIPTQRRLSPGISTERFPGYGHYSEEVILTEYVYNFGPRKLMRRLMFEGGVLVKIETIGYGYREQKSK
jgi:hypothetical protein